MTMVKMTSEVQIAMTPDKINLGDVAPSQSLDTIEYDLLTRTSWTDASIAYEEIKQVRLELKI